MGNWDFIKARSIIDAVDQIIDEHQKGFIDDDEREKSLEEVKRTVEFMGKQGRIERLMQRIEEFKAIHIVEDGMYLRCSCREKDDPNDTKCINDYDVSRHEYPRTYNRCVLGLPCMDIVEHDDVRRETRMVREIIYSRSLFENARQELIDAHEIELEAMKRDDGRYTIRCACGKTVTSSKNPHGTIAWCGVTPKDDEHVRLIETETGWHFVPGSAGHGRFLCSSCYTRLIDDVHALERAGLLSPDTITFTLFDACPAGHLNTKRGMTGTDTHETHQGHE